MKNHDMVLQNKQWMGLEAAVEAAIEFLEKVANAYYSNHTIY